MTPAQIETIARETMVKFEVPGLAILYQRGANETETLFLGTDAASEPVTRHSLFIVASITKLATALCVLRLVDIGVLALDDPLSKYLPEARGAQEGVTLRTLLCHISGLPQDLPNEQELYGAPMTWDDLARECLKVELELPPRTRVVYSNVGYGLLGLVVERAMQGKFLNGVRELVLEPLDIEGYLGDEPPREPMKLADVRSGHVGTDIEPYNSRYYLRLGLPWSGLVTTAEGALKLVRAFAGEPRDILSDALRHEATQNQTDDLAGGYGGRFDYPRAPWGLGVDLRGDKKPHWTPSNASPRTFGHAGASGCVGWHDPEAKVSWAILGTRTADNAWLVRGAPKIAEAILMS
jgi:CubicO group peptidase (beta-lactamase class C family)